jgi:hypothetical protein
MNGSAGCVAAAELVNLPVSVGDMGDSLVVGGCPGSRGISSSADGRRR